jgi:hypothetical protein
MRPVRITKSLAAADDDNISLSQTPAGAGNLTITGAAAVGGVGILDTARQVILTFAADETGHTFVVYGNTRADGTGNPIQETIAGTTAGVVASAYDYGRVSRVSISAAATGAIKVGTNGVGDTEWVLVDQNLDPTSLSIMVDVTGTVNYTVQYTYDQIMGYYDPGGAWTNTYPSKIFDDPVLAAATIDGETTFNNPVNAWRVRINSGTGSVTVTGIQAGVGGIGS